MAAFEDYGVMPELISGLQQLGWELPRDIQAECIPLILGGGDVMAAAETGSGKTGAFAIPLIQIVYESLREGVQPKVKPSNEPVVLNVADRDSNFVISPDGIIAQSRNMLKWSGARANVGVIQGCFYYEAIIRDEGLCRIGWSTKSASLDLGTDKDGFGYGGTSKKSNVKFNTYGEPFGKGDVIGSYIDCDNRTISFSKNGKFLGEAFSIPTSKFAFYPAICLKNAELEVNFGASTFKFPPTGNLIHFKPITQAEPQQLATYAAQSCESSNRNPLAIIIEPTRELAQQTFESIELFKKMLPVPPIQQVLLVGGEDAIKQAEAIKTGSDIVTATPGRLQEFVDGEVLDLSDVRFFILDEADSLVEQYHPLIMKIYNLLNKTNALQILMFSATLHSYKVKKLGEEICKYPIWVDLKGKDAIPETVDFGVVFADPIENKNWINPKPLKIQTDRIHAKDNTKPTSNTPEMLSEAIKILKPILLVKIINAYKMDQAIIFCRTKLDCDNLEEYLNQLSPKKGAMADTEYSCVVLHSDRPQSERKANIKAFKDGDVRFLISTDVGARGIDIKELPFVINFTLPDKAEDFIHRCGRVGRADKMGLAISIVATCKEKVWYHKCKSRGKNCNDRRLAEQGGCTIWYDEPKYWREIENRLGITVPRLDENFKMIGEQNVVYGEKKDGGESTIFLGHAQQLEPLITDLAQLEDNAQRIFWETQLKWTKKKK